MNKKTINFEKKWVDILLVGGSNSTENENPSGGITVLNVGFPF
jgi:hypothetical protein